MSLNLCGPHLLPISAAPFHFFFCALLTHRHIREYYMSNWRNWNWCVLLGLITPGVYSRSTHVLNTSVTRTDQHRRHYHDYNSINCHKPFSSYFKRSSARNVFRSIAEVISPFSKTSKSTSAAGDVHLSRLVFVINAVDDVTRNQWPN